MEYIPVHTPKRSLQRHLLRGKKNIFFLRHKHLNLLIPYISNAMVVYLMSIFLYGHVVTVIKKKRLHDMTTASKKHALPTF